MKLIATIIITFFLSLFFVSTSVTAIIVEAPSIGNARQLWHDGDQPIDVMDDNDVEAVMNGQVVVTHDDTTLYVSRLRGHSTEPQTAVFPIDNAPRRYLRLAMQGSP